MLISVLGLTKRKSVYWYRRTVPPRLRALVGAREIKRSLGTGDEAKALRILPTIKADIDRQLAEAQAGLKSPSVASYKAVAEWKAGNIGRLPDEQAEEGLDLHLTTLLERGDGPNGKPLDATQRAILEGLLKRHEGADDDNPPLSILFERYFTERKLPAKTKLEWSLVLKRFTSSLGGADLPVKSITQAHVRSFKAGLLRQTVTGSTATKVRTLSPATIQKTLNGLRAVLSWAKREGYITNNPAADITQLRTKDNDEDRRLPFTVEQARQIIAKLPESGYMRWLWIIGLYSGARLAEIAGLRQEDVRNIEGVMCFDIRPHAARRLKNRASRRLVPIHPEILKAGFSASVLPFKSDAHYFSRRINPWLRSVVGITDSRLSFHSARHAVKDRLRAARIPESEQRALMGHGATAVADGYGSGFPLSVLADAMSKVRY
jgi:integrase